MILYFFTSTVPLNYRYIYIIITLCVCTCTCMYVAPNILLYYRVTYSQKYCREFIFADCMSFLKNAAKMYCLHTHMSLVEKLQTQKPQTAFFATNRNILPYNLLFIRAQYLCE